MTRAGTVAAVALAPLAFLACGSDDATTVGTVPATDAPAATEAPVATAALSATEAPAPSEAPAATEVSAPPATETPVPASFRDALGLAAIELVPAATGEAQPMLSWAAVDGAASYRLVALTSDASPYWAWAGDAIEVRFGGAPDGGGQTAIVFEPMTWAVVALDAEGTPIAVSDPGDLSP